MIKVNGNDVENFPVGKNLDDMLMGELHSAAMYFLKTPAKVYGSSIEELMRYAYLVKMQDESYDTIEIYSEAECAGGERDWIETKEI